MREAGRVMSKSHVLTTLRGVTVDVWSGDGEPVTFHNPFLSSKNCIFVSSRMPVLSVLQLTAGFSMIVWHYALHNYDIIIESRRDLHVNFMCEVRLEVPLILLLSKNTVSPKSPCFLVALSGMSLFKGIFHFSRWCISFFSLSTENGFELQRSRQCINTHTQTHRPTQTYTHV